MPLVLFDIDGTILSARGAGRRALAAALTEVYGGAGDIEGYDLRGQTDQRIVFDLMEAVVSRASESAHVSTIASRPTRVGSKPRSAMARAWSSCRASPTWSGGWTERREPSWACSREISRRARGSS